MDYRTALLWTYLILLLAWVGGAIVYTILF
jgi:hypothetical protein